MNKILFFAKLLFVVTAILFACSGKSATNIPVAVNPLDGITINFEMIASGFDQPVNVVSAFDGSGRLFVVERGGTIRILKDGAINPAAFLDISDKVESGFTEQGLLDVAFHPNFNQNGFLYVNYTEIQTNGGTVIARYTVSPGTPDSADPVSEKVLLRYDQPYANHNGGELEFGPDGYLYIGAGDGGSAGDPHGNGQSLTTHLGKILRIDVDTGGSQPYMIPPDNPFIVPSGPGTENRKPEIWAYGLRNPWKFSFDPSTGDLYIADVGQDNYEEVNFQPAGSQGGVNYGWNLMEGIHCYPIGRTPCENTGTLPVTEYSHDDGCSVTGIGVYRGVDFPLIAGIYFYADYCSGNVWGLTRDNVGNWVSKLLLQTNLRITGSGASEDGSLYVTSFDNPSGSVWRLVAN